MMFLIDALSFAPHTRDWLAKSRQPRMLHIFNHACNLINERKEVLSVVTQQVGNGPFNLVTADGVLFSKHLSIESPISIHSGQLTLGDLVINSSEANLWSPRPDWEKLYAISMDIHDQLTSLPIMNYQPLLPASLISNLSSALAVGDISYTQKMTSQLAGLGAGLTPAGDDYLLGAVYAAWIIHPRKVARVLAEGIAQIASPLTTSLSAAWLRAGARGEAGELWHDFLNALLIGDSEAIQLQAAKLTSIGHTSGADAMSGFIGTLRYWMAKRGYDISPSSS